jgi:hypothetical protein
VVGEAIARVGRVKLLFGEDSEPANRAEDLVRQLEHTLTYARDGKEMIEAWDRLAWNQLEKAYAKHRDFNRAALQMITRDGQTGLAETVITLARSIDNLGKAR